MVQLITIDFINSAKKKYKNSSQFFAKDSRFHVFSSKLDARRMNSSRAQWYENRTHTFYFLASNEFDDC